MLTYENTMPGPVTVMGPHARGCHSRTELSLMNGAVTLERSCHSRTELSLSNGAVTHEGMLTAGRLRTYQTSMPKHGIFMS